MVLFFILYLIPIFSKKCYKYCRKTNTFAKYYFFFKNGLTVSQSSCNIIYVVKKIATNGDLAQLARAFGSYPKGRGFDPLGRHNRPLGQAVKTPPFHGGNTGSNPVGVILKEAFQLGKFLFLFFYDNNKLIESCYIKNLLQLL